MRITHRAYDETQDDFARLGRFVLGDYAHRGGDFIWTFGRIVDWKYGLWSENKYFPTFYPRNAQLWFAAFQELVGFLISETGNGDFTVFTAPGHGHLEAEMVDWAIANWLPCHGALRTEVREEDAALRALLEARGFTGSPAAITQKYDLAAKAREPVVLPSGFRIVDMIENQDFRSKKALTANAFQNRAEVRDADVLAYEYARQSPIYEARYDLSVIDGAGRHLSACEGFVDYTQRMAEVERVCTHSDYRRLGLAEAVIRACFHRLYANGVEVAYITGYSGEAKGLYARLGAIEAKQWLLYARSA